MRKRAYSLFVLVVVIAGAFAATALAATKTATGKITSYKGHTLVVKTSSASKSFQTTAATICGYSTGQSGGPVACKSLGSKYRGKKVIVTYTVKGHVNDATKVIVQTK